MAQHAQRTHGEPEGEHNAAQVANGRFRDAATTSLHVGPEGAVYRVCLDGVPHQIASDLGVACGIAFDADGVMYVGDRSGTIFRVRNGEASPFVRLPPSVAAFHLAMSPEGELFVAEGDESDGTLVKFEPRHAIILNIEPEHLDFYEDIEAIKTVFRQLLEKAGGLTVYCAEDERDPASTSRDPVVSAVHLKVPTLGEFMKAANPASRNVAVSAKDRAVMMMGGTSTPKRAAYFRAEASMSRTTRPTWQMTLLPK